MNVVKCSEEQVFNEGQPAFTLETNHIKAQMEQISENSALECLFGKRPRLQHSKSSCSRENIPTTVRNLGDMVK